MSFVPLSVPAPRKGVVLMREEDRALNDTVVEFLERLGWRVIALDATCRTMTWWAARQQPTIALLEVHSLTSQNCNLLALLMSAIPRMPVIVITSFGDVLVSRWAEELGASHVIEKPFALADLERVLESFAR